MKSDLPIVMLDEEPKGEPPVRADDAFRYVSTFLTGFGACAALVICWLAVVWLEGGMK